NEAAHRHQSRAHNLRPGDRQARNGAGVGHRRPRPEAGFPPRRRTGAHDARAMSDATDLARSGNDFAFALYPVLAPVDQNFVFSPVSISTLLSTLASAASGETARELLRALRVRLEGPRLEAAVTALLEELLSPEGQSPEVELRMPGGVWVQSGEEI